MVKKIDMFGFPSIEPAEEIKKFLEKYTGEGTVCVEEVGRRPGGSRAYAKVQITTSSGAAMILSLAGDKQLWYGDSYLKAREVGREFSSHRMDNIGVHLGCHTAKLRMDNIGLHLGCQTAKQKFLVLWKAENVSVKFGLGLRKMYFFLSHLGVQYKLELPYENFEQIELHRSCSEDKKFLLIQLLGAPSIYQEEDVPALSNYNQKAANDKWVRVIDFTPLGCIGQSSALCLELPSRGELPNFRDHFVHYKENEGRFTREDGYSFSCNSDLVPIVSPPQGLNLPYNILFQINSLVQHGCLPGPALDLKFFRLVDPSRINIAYIEHALEKLYHFKDCCYEPEKWLTEQYQNYIMSNRLPSSPSICLDDGLVYVRRVQVTPSKVYFCGPEINLSNRVLRNYPGDIDNFLRVSFVDESLDKMYLSPYASSANEERGTSIYGRILSTLRNGIVIGDKKFEFLAFSSSQLRENSLWMFASRDGLTAADIRDWMGDFRNIRNVAKYAARLGQSFSSSRESLEVGTHEIEIIPDVKIERGGVTYVFSDGIGKISEKLAKKVARKCGCGEFVPSAFQFRYGGFKGVVAVDPTSSVKLSLRDSMCKFKSQNVKLDILEWSKYHPCFLNRQIIALLSTLGVQDHVFEKKQKEAVQQLDALLSDSLRAQEALELMSPGENTNILKEMILCGYKPDAEPFLSMMLQTFRGSKLLDLRIKTKIFVPKGRSMLGCLDETGTLEYGQVFVQCSSRGSGQVYDDSSVRFSGSGSDHRNFIVDQKVVVAKCPCLHPGDIRVLTAVNVPALHHMVDCVVFPQKGKRPHPNECSGSDLDGDLYFVCWDRDLIPPRQFRPMDYTPAPPILLDHDVTIEEVEEYFANHMVNDCLGRIAHAHVAFADKEPSKAKSKPCLELARLHSDAVDFPKTGVPVKVPRRLRVKEYPDFMEKPNKPTYQSQRVIGRLYREVKGIAPDTNCTRPFTREVSQRSYDPDMEVDGFEDYISDAFLYKTAYDFRLGNLMEYYGIETEGEILSGSIIKMSNSFDKRRDLDAIVSSIKSLRNEARKWFNNHGSESDSDTGDEYAKASAWYYVTYHHSYWGKYNEGMGRDHFLSFPWCVYEKLIHIKKDKARSMSASHLSALQESFRCGLTFG